MKKILWAKTLHATLRTMKWTALIGAVLISTMCVTMASPSEGQGLLNRRLTITVRNNPLGEALDKIARAMNVRFSYSGTLAADKSGVSFTVKNEPLKNVLEQLLKEYPYSYTVLDNEIIFSYDHRKALALQGPREIRVPPVVVTGKVTDEKGRPIAGATVSSKFGAAITATDSLGNFRIRLKDGDDVLVCSHVGYRVQEIRVVNRETLTIVMHTEESRLNEVVIVGYGTQQRSELAAAISTVKAEDIRNIPTTNAIQALEGKMSGVLVTSDNGAVPGFPVNIRIRGTNTIRPNTSPTADLNTGTAPLYIVDGIPFYNQNTSQAFAADVSPINAINVNDIESIEVLKDAAASAIYGSRGANGVVIITTKKGNSGQQGKVEANAFSGFVNTSRIVPVMNTPEWRTVRREMLLNSGITPTAVSAPELFLLDSTVNTNWQKAFYKTGRVYDANLALSGGTTASNYYFSGSYRDEGTNTVNPALGLKRYVARLNMNNQLNKWLSSGLTMNYSKETNVRAQGQLDVSNRGPLNANPQVPAYDSTGKLNINYFPPAQIRNPLALLFLTNDQVNTDQFNGNWNFNARLPLNLNFRTDLSYQQIDNKDLYYFDGAVNNQTSANSSSQNASSQTRSFSVEPQLNYSAHLGRHALRALLGSTFQNRDIYRQSINGTGYPNDNFTDIGFAQSLGSQSSSRVKYRYASLFGRLNYNYDQKYFADLTLRDDASSRFGPGRRSGLFGAAGLAWELSKERFFSSQKFFNQAKLRFSYGITGNDNIPDFQYLNLYNLNAYNASYGGVAGSIPSNLSNPLLQWEQTGKLDVGLDLGFWQQRVNLTVNYFNDRTSKMLFANPLSSTAGFSSVQANINGLIVNSGFELELEVLTIRAKDFSFRNSFNVTTIHNVLKKLPGLATSPYRYTYKIGQPVELVWGYDYKGVDPQTGKALLTDFNKDGFYGNDDKVILGKYQPDFYGGLTNSFSYKYLNLEFFWNYAQGNIRQNYYYAGYGYYNFPKFVLNRWQKPGDHTNVPRLSTNSTTDPTFSYYWSSMANYSDASYIRLKTLTFSVSPDKIWKKQKDFPLKRLYVSGYNLLTFTKFKGGDPENTGGDSLPLPKSFIVGLNISF